MSKFRALREFCLYVDGLGRALKTAGLVPRFFTPHCLSGLGQLDPSHAN
jgi:hypothetical protein